jgi:hypothetical protein
MGGRKESKSANYLDLFGTSMWIVFFLLFIPSIAFGQLSAINCERLDPRTRVSNETETKINASVKTVLKVAQAGGEIQRKAKEEIQNLSTTTTSKDQIEARWIYLFCEMLRTSGNLSDAQKKQYFDAVFQAIKPIPAAPPAKGQNKERTSGVKAPNVTILGALPLNLWKADPLPREPSQPNRAPFSGHQLAFIIKVQDNTSLPIRVNLAILEGCTSIGVHAVHTLGKKLLLEGETLPPSVSDPAYAELERTTIQRIKVSGTIRANSEDLVPSGLSYIGVMFPVRSGGRVTMEAPGTVSTKGKCDAISKWTSQPSISQLLKIGAIAYELPKDIAPEFRDGRLKISLHTSKEALELNPKVIGTIYSVREEHWQSLLLPEMYEVPDQDYPPRLR